MQHLLFWIFGAFAGYLCGSLSSAVIVCRAMGFGDPVSYTHLTLPTSDLV